MTNRSNDYFVKINPYFLFDSQALFKSYFTPWVYLYLKLEKNFLITKPTHNEFKINNKDLCDFFIIDRSTVYRAVQELINSGLLKKSGGKYRIFDEENFISGHLALNSTQLSEENEVAKENEQLCLEKEEEQPDSESSKKFPAFIKIFQTEFLRLFREVTNYQEHLKDYSRTILKTAEIYYFLTSLNRHCLLEHIGALESKETQTSISRKLKHDNRFTAAMLDILYRLGYIELYKDGSIYTIKKGQSSCFYRKGSVLSQKQEVIGERILGEETYFETSADKSITSEESREEYFPTNASNLNIKDSIHETTIPKGEPVTHEEIMGYLYTTHKNNLDLFEQKALNHGVSYDDIESWLEYKRDEEIHLNAA